MTWNVEHLGDGRSLALSWVWSGVVWYLLIDRRQDKTSIRERQPVATSIDRLQSSVLALGGGRLLQQPGAEASALAMQAPIYLQITATRVVAGDAPQFRHVYSTVDWEYNMLSRVALSSTVLSAHFTLHIASQLNFP